MAHVLVGETTLNSALSSHITKSQEPVKLLRWIVQSFYGKKSVNLPLIATEGFSTVLDSAMYPY